MLTGPELIKKKQKSLIVLRTISLSLLILIPLTINFLNHQQFKPWQIAIGIGCLGACLLLLHRLQMSFSHEIERACHQLGPGVKLFKKFQRSENNKYQIFQEGQRYYYILHLQTGEKRLVQKDKILQDYDIAL